MDRMFKKITNPGVNDGCVPFYELKVLGGDATGVFNYTNLIETKN